MMREIDLSLALEHHFKNNVARWIIRAKLLASKTDPAVVECTKCWGCELQCIPIRRDCPPHNDTVFAKVVRQQLENVAIPRYCAKDDLPVFTVLFIKIFERCQVSVLLDAFPRLTP